MFRGGDYIDKNVFADLQNNPGRNKMDISDIAGAKPKRLHVSRRFGDVAGNILADNSKMVAAGSLKQERAGAGLNDIFKMGNQFQRY